MTADRTTDLEELPHWALCRLAAEKAEFIAGKGFADVAAVMEELHHRFVALSEEIPTNPPPSPVAILIVGALSGGFMGAGMASLCWWLLS